MSIKLDDYINKLSEKNQNEINNRTNILLTEEKNLQELCKDNIARKHQISAVIPPQDGIHT